MPWIWSCHKCHTRYLLGATRRCLLDGHYFCGGATVDKISGKVRKHRACVSEFDYSGWEDFNRWKRATTGHIRRFGNKHCEDDCNFPSSCHWEEEHAAQDTGVAYRDPSCLDKEPDASSVDDKLAFHKGTDNHVRKVRKTADRRTTQGAKTILPAIEEEDQKASPSVDAPPKWNGLSLHYPVMDFLSSTNDADEGGEIVGEGQMKLTTPRNQQMSARINKGREEEVDRTDWIREEAGESPSPCPFAEAEALSVPFDFSLEQDDSVAASLANDDLVVSAMSSTWDWTAGGIGVALSPPDLLAEGEDWEEQVEEEREDIVMSWG